jgi:hypothetical protein
MAYIESAFYGDERTSRDITKVLAEKILGSSIDVDVNEKILPPFEVTPKVELKPQEEKKIKDDAVKACGGADQACIERTEARLRQDTLVAKQQTNESNEALIKGKRLTVNIIENGKRVRKVIPDGNKFKYDNLVSTDPKKGIDALPSLSQMQSQLKVLGVLVLSTMIYVFSVAATYTLFMPMGPLVAVPTTAIAIFIPYSGYFIMFLYYMFSGAINTYIGKI